MKCLLSFNGHDRDETAGKCKIDSLRQVTMQPTPSTAAESNRTLCWEILVLNH